jgi:hypothetical protein
MDNNDKLEELVFEALSYVTVVRDSCDFNDCFCQRVVLNKAVQVLEEVENIVFDM